MAKNHVWHGFTLILEVLIDFSSQKTQEKKPYMAVLPQNKKYIILVAPRVPKMANYGQKSCLAWFQAYIRGFNRFLVPKSIENDTPHAHINQKYIFLDFYKVRKTKKLGVVKNGCGRSNQNWRSLDIGFKWFKVTVPGEKSIWALSSNEKTIGPPLFMGFMVIYDML